MTQICAIMKIRWLSVFPQWGKLILINWLAIYESVRICTVIAPATSQKGDLSRLVGLAGVVTPPHRLS